MSGFNFDEKSAKRVVTATKYVERLQRNQGNDATGNGGNRSEGFWAKLTDGSGGKYSWVSMKSDSASLKLVEESEWGSGDHTADNGYAVELINASPDCMIGDTVWLVPAKGDVDFYTFYYEGRCHMGHLTKSVSNGISDIYSGYSDYPSTNGKAQLYRFSRSQQQYSGSQIVTVANGMTSEVRGNYGGRRFLFLTFWDGYWWITGAACGSW